jgi:flagellar FliL protein
MADEPKTKSKSGKGRILLIALGAVVVAAGGAGGGFYFASQASAEPKKGPATDDNAVKPGAETYYAELEKGFTSNLREPEHYIELTIGVSTQKEQAVIDAVKKHEVAIRSGVLSTLADQSVEDISTPQGKAKLLLQLRDVVNRTLKEREGQGGVSNVYFTSFIVQ